MFKKNKYNYLDVKDMNRLLQWCRETCVNIYFRPKEPDEEFKQNCYILQKKTTLYVYVKVTKRAEVYVCNLSNEEQKHFRNGLDAFAIFSRDGKVQKYEDAKKVGSAKAFLYKNPEYAGKRVKAWSYDVKSAYGRMLLEPIPNLDTMRTYGYLREGEMGFQELPFGELRMTFKVGAYCEYIFKPMPSPYKKYVERWYKRKERATNSKDKSIAKDMLNYPIGYCQNINPFLRACIVSRCNMYIKQFVDENTIYSNTDCIVSAVPRPDLELLVGDSVGEFSKDHSGRMFAWSKDSFNYQWDKEIPMVRGIPKAWFKTFEKINGRKFDLLVDKLPTGGNIFYFDEKEFKIKKRIYEKIS